MGVDPAALSEAVAHLNVVMRPHAGGVALESVSADGDVRVRFTGMCQGCSYKALTWHATVERALLAVDGVRSVDAPGVRVSEEALGRLRHYGQDSLLPAPTADPDPSVPAPGRRAASEGDTGQVRGSGPAS